LILFDLSHASMANLIYPMTIYLGYMRKKIEVQMFEISLNAHDALIMLSHEKTRKTHLSHAFSPQQTQPKCSCRGSFCDGLHCCVTSPSGILAGVVSAMALETISAPLLTYIVLHKCHKSERQTRQQARLDNKQCGVDQTNVA
jgi:hypothetical protein